MASHFRLECSIDGAPAKPLGDRDAIDLAAGAELRVSLSDSHWFGHGFSHEQPWPLEAGQIAADPFAVNNCQSPMWLCSTGVGLLADTTEALAVAINRDGDGLLRIRCDAGPLTVRVFRGADAREAHAAMLAAVGWPNPAPAPHVLGDSIFCTWTQYPRTITQDRVLAMADAIRTRGWPCSTLTIDDRWEASFGQLEFSDDFPDPAGMVARLHELGLSVLLWVTPFVNVESPNFAPLAEAGALVRQRGRDGTAATFRWWGGQAGLVDLTGPAGRDWFVGRLTELRDRVGVDGFKIDGGDAKYQPAPADACWADAPGPSGYSDQLLAAFEQVAPGVCETRTMWMSQRRSILWRQGGKDSHWRSDNGLRAMVRLGLHMALMGYDIQIPDMIPGRVQTMSSDDPLVPDELFVRWAEATAMFPIMQFSYFPWNYAEPTEAAALGLARLHKSLEGYLHASAANRVAPLIRPLWYDWPAREELFTVDDQWLLGPDLLAAPVLTPGAESRGVVLPPGLWVDAWSGQTHEGPAARPDVPAPCPGMPIFVRAENEELLRTVQPALAAIDRGSVSAGVTSATWQSGLDRDLSVTG